MDCFDSIYRFLCCFKCTGSFYSLQNVYFSRLSPKKRGNLNDDAFFVLKVIHHLVDGCLKHKTGKNHLVDGCLKRKTCKNHLVDGCLKHKTRKNHLVDSRRTYWMGVNQMMDGCRTQMVIVIATTDYSLLNRVIINHPNGEYFGCAGRKVHFHTILNKDDGSPLLFFAGQKLRSRIIAGIPKDLKYKKEALCCFHIKNNSLLPENRLKAA